MIDPKFYIVIDELSFFSNESRGKHRVAHDFDLSQIVELDSDFYKCGYAHFKGFGKEGGYIYQQLHKSQVEPLN